MKLRSTSIFVIVVLGVAVLCQLIPKRTAYHYQLKKELGDWLPSPLIGWTVEDVPIASTPEVAKAVDQLLNFSDGIYRVYSSGTKNIKVYVAYWVPGKMDPRLVAVHSPDVCWIGAGWKLVGEPLRRSFYGNDGSALINGHDRVFQINGHQEEVVFWHLIGGKPSRYLDSNGPGLAWWTAQEIFRNPLAPRYEQYFIRISTDGSLSALAADPMMKNIIDSLSVLKLR